MFDSVLKTSCEIIEYGWNKDRTPVDTFIMGLATSIREHNDYEEKVGCILELMMILMQNNNVTLRCYRDEGYSYGNEYLISVCIYYFRMLKRRRLYLLYSSMLSDCLRS